MLTYQWRPSIRTDYLVGNCNRRSINTPLIARTFHERVSPSTGTNISNPQHGMRRDCSLLMDVSSTLSQFDVAQVPVLRLGTDNTSVSRARFSNVYIPDDLTVMVVFTPRRQTAAKDVTLFAKWNTGGVPGSNEWFLGLNASGDGSDWHFAWAVESGTSQTVLKDTALWVANQRYVVVGARKRVSGEMALYKDGILVAGTGSAVNGAINNVRTQIDFGCIQAAASFNSQCDYEAVMIWDQALPLRWIRDLSTDPYQLWVPPKTRFIPGRVSTNFGRQTTLRGVGRGMVRGIR